MSIRDNLGGGSAGSVLDKMEEIAANTEAGKPAGALALKEFSGGVTEFIVDETTGKLAGYKTGIGGSDKIFPFSGGLDLLWTNPNPTSAFKAQTLSIDLSGYESVVIQAKGWNETATYSPLRILIPKDGNQYIIAGNQKNYTESGKIESINVYMRLVTVNNDGITFTIGYVSGATTNNQACIPLEIYGCGISLE